MRLTLFLLVATLPLAVASEARAQQRSGPSLPAWAAPQQSQPQTTSQQRSPSRTPDDGTGTNDAPPNDRQPPAQAPLGGLEWLVLAGGAYAANRLRRNKDTNGDASPASK